MPRFQYSLRALLVVTTLVAIAAASLPLWLHWFGYVFFFVSSIPVGARLFAETFYESPRDTLVVLITLAIPVTVMSVLAWALVAALRER